MELVKKNKDNLIYKKKTGRYAVKTLKGKFINGDEKTKILLDAKLIKAAAPKKKEETPAEDAAPEAPAEEAKE